MFHRFIKHLFFQMQFLGLYNLLQQLLNYINDPLKFSDVLIFNKTTNERIGEIIVMSKQIIQDEMKLILKNK